METYAVAEEIPMEKYISQDNSCYDQIPKPISVGANTKHTTISRATRDSCKDSKTLLIIVIAAIILILSATCACTIYTLSRLESEIGSRKITLASSNTASLYS